ncbi:hypothetical protein X756_31750 [Mesorhizobium sp. LSHC412B00]|nr:hypothetical protein X756_31750 [Mesorhizobium sp. LSHC412B00]
MPGQRYYSETVVNPANGERFIDLNFRPSSRLMM